MAIAAAPADAKKRKPADAKPEKGIADLDTSEPMVLVVSLKQQKLDVYRGTTLVTTSQVSTGMPGHATKAGVFSILEKQRFHHSNIYSGAPMPWMNRITWSGTALHAGVVPGYPASHGCIRLPFSFAPKLFKITTVGDNVIVARDRPVPKLIEHPALFQPLPPPPPPGDGDAGAAAASVDERYPAASGPAEAASGHAGKSRCFRLRDRRPVFARGRGGRPERRADH